MVLKDVDPVMTRLSVEWIQNKYFIDLYLVGDRQARYGILLFGD